MTPRLPGPARTESAPLVLVAVVDAKVLDLISFALEASHFRVRSAGDGEQALRIALADRPLLIIADVRLAHRSGLELCATLRRDTEHGDVAVLLLSPHADADARIEALAHGADDLVTQPFSAKELVARVERLVARGRDVQRHRRRSAELERDLVRLDAEVGRARELAARERGLRELVGGVTEGWLRTLDLEALDARILREVVQCTGARSAALLTASDDCFTVAAVRGELMERWQSLTLPRDAECLVLARTLARALRSDDLDRTRQAVCEVGRLAAHGVALLAVLAGADGIEGVIVCEDRADGGGFTPGVRDRLHALATLAAPVRSTARRFRAQQDRALELLVAHAAADPRRRQASRETTERLLPLAEVWSLDRVARATLTLAWDIGPWGWSESGHDALAAFADSDPTARLRRVRDSLLRAFEVAEGRLEGDRVERLLAAGLRYQSLRLGGRSPYEAWRTTGEWLGVAGDPELRDRFPESFEAARDERAKLDIA